MEEEVKPKKIKNVYKPIEIGDVYYYLTVLSKSDLSTPKKKFWVCRCKCGKEIPVRGSYLKMGHTKSCGCRKAHLETLKDIGNKYGKWTVLENLGVNKTFRRYYWCRCDCGTEKKVGIDLLRGGQSKSCGCSYYDKRKTYPASKVKFHGESKTEMYHIWRGILARCFNKKDKGYQNYGGRGITVFPEWTNGEGFLKFKEYIGPRPSKHHSVDRINNDGNYEPGNIRWATQKEQNNNKRTFIKKIKDCPLLPLDSFIKVTIYDDIISK